mmetsp:Transcript_42116/g.127779  ORF Transcript_42116/g.127779 Transcript_42116/m.127779 type:complete len:80 (-) Transcript_42116:467-706(-)
MRVPAASRSETARRQEGGRSLLRVPRIGGDDDGRCGGDDGRLPTKVDSPSSPTLASKPPLAVVGLLNKSVVRPLAAASV